MLLQNGFTHHLQDNWLSYFPQHLLAYWSKRSPTPQLSYWYRPHRSKTKSPFVFVHGIGVCWFNDFDFIYNPILTVIVFVDWFMAVCPLLPRHHQRRPRSWNLCYWNLPHKYAHVPTPTQSVCRAWSHTNHSRFPRTTELRLIRSLIWNHRRRACS